MSKFVIATGIAFASILGIAGCGSTGETVGTVGGAAVGGAIGSEVSGGSTIGTIGGAAAGGYIGHQMGERYEERQNRR
jgi:osmotically inducible lipoprotein OsmB